MGNSNSEFDSDKVRRIRVPLEMVTCCGFYFVSRLTFLLRDLIVFARFNFCFVCVVGGVFSFVARALFLL